MRLFPALLGLAVLSALTAGTASAAAGAGASVVNEEILGRFERDVSDLATQINGWAVRRRELARKGEELQLEAEKLRRETHRNPQVLNEARLRNILGELKTNLDLRAEEDRREEELRRTFEEQVLSLAVLYNDRIETLLDSYRPVPPPGNDSGVLREILRLTGRRANLQREAEKLGDAYGVSTDETFPDFAMVLSGDPINLRLARGFLEDRESQLKDRLERSSLRETEMRRELRLEERARAILSLESAAEDPDPLVRAGFTVLNGTGEHWKSRLAVLSNDRVHDQALLARTRQWMAKVDAALRAPAPAPGEMP